MYLLINPDNTVNFADDHPINDALDLNGLRLIEIKEKSLDKVVEEIHPEVAIWDEVSKKVRTDPLSVSLRQESVNKRREAQKKIKQHYPFWKQLNILREGNPKKIEVMGKFIDACRKWSNSTSTTAAQLEKITP